MIKAVLFDLDGTLLPMDQAEFLQNYFPYLTAKMVPYGFDPKELADSIWKGTGRMVVNDGSRTNEDVFWEYFTERYGSDSLKYRSVFEEYYANEFCKTKEICGYEPLAKPIVDRLKAAGKRLALATNPVFPRMAIDLRVTWAGLKPSDFDLITSYETSHYSKPNPEYYREIADCLGIDPSECLMVGNDVTEDMVASTIGMETFLVTGCLINTKDIDISGFRKGTFEDLSKYLDELL